jgi:hypothetical protein
VLDFLFTGVRVDLQETMNERARELASKHAMATIQEVVSELIKDEMHTGALDDEKGKAALSEIDALSSSGTSEEERKYRALVVAITTASYSQLRSRLGRRVKNRRGLRR